MVLDHSKRPVNKAGSFRYMPSEPEPLWWSTDSQKYQCRHYCGVSRNTRGKPFYFSLLFSVLLGCVAINILVTNTFTSSDSLVSVYCCFTFVLETEYSAVYEDGNNSCNKDCLNDVKGINFFFYVNKQRYGGIRKYKQNNHKFTLRQKWVF